MITLMLCMPSFWEDACARAVDKSLQERLDAVYGSFGVSVSDLFQLQVVK
jgi:hypothetical protein